MLGHCAGWLARRRSLPTSARALFGYYAAAGTFDYGSLSLKRRVDDVTEAMIADAFAAVEEAIAEEFGYGYVSFEYDTKLVLPAQLALGYCYRHLEEEYHEEAEEMTRLAIEALLDGDMRDAINDEEYDDFVVGFPTNEADRGLIAKIAQEVLQARVEEQFTRYPDAVREQYDWAVGISEAHQDEDEHFRNLMARAREGDSAAHEDIRAEYRDAPFEEEPAVLTREELTLPYIKTQYDRVGIIYDAMVEMYRAGGLSIDDTFKRSIVLAIVGAQVWLDDVDDYAADMREKQLTPVTAEYLLAEDDRAAYERVISISEAYLDRARTSATAADSALTGIATEYIYRDGDPSVLPGAH